MIAPAASRGKVHQILQQRAAEPILRNPCRLVRQVHQILAAVTLPKNEDR